MAPLEPHFHLQPANLADMPKYPAAKKHVFAVFYWHFADLIAATAD